MESTIEQLGEYAAVRVSYRALDAHTAKDFRSELDAICAEHSQILLDLEGVEFVDSAGLGAIVASLKQLRANGGEIRICSVQKPVRALFELVRMHKLVEIFNNRDEAITN